MDRTGQLPLVWTPQVQRVTLAPDDLYWQIKDLPKCYVCGSEVSGSTSFLAPQ